MSPAAGDRLRWAAPVLVSAVLAGTAALVLALRLAPRFDELHTLAYLQDPDLRSLWRSYRSVGDTLPPAGYVGWWGWSQVAGTSLTAVRIPVVVSWAVLAGATTALTRRAGAWASLAAGLLATSSALVFLGAYARPYAPALAATALALCCWSRAATAERARPWLVGCGLLFATASILHYALAAVAVLVAVVTVAGGPSVVCRRGRSLAAVLGGVVPVLASGALLPQAVEDQGRLDRSVRLVDAAVFWPSTLRPAALPIAAVVVFSVAAVLIPGERGARARTRLLDRELLRSGWVVALAVPIAAVGAMALTSGTYVHRYAAGALLGAAVVVAEATGRAARRWRWAGPAVAVLVVLGGVLATASVANDLVSRSEAADLAGQLGVEPEGPPIVVLEEYDLRLLDAAAPDAVVDRLVPGSEPVIAHGWVPVDLGARFAGTEPILVIGNPASVSTLVADHPGWDATTLGEAGYARPDVDQALVYVRLDPRR